MLCEGSKVVVSIQGAALVTLRYVPTPVATHIDRLAHNAHQLILARRLELFGICHELVDGCVDLCRGGVLLELGEAGLEGLEAVAGDEVGRVAREEGADAVDRLAGQAEIQAEVAVQAGEEELRRMREGWWWLASVHGGVRGKSGAHGGADVGEEANFLRSDELMCQSETKG